MAWRSKTGKAVKRARTFVVTIFTRQSIDAASPSIGNAQPRLRKQVQYVRIRQAMSAHLTMPRQEMFLRAPSPGTHKIIVQRAADPGAEQWNQPARPFLGHF